MTKQEFLQKAYPAAVRAGHIWPEYAVCEAALESAWGESKLCRMANNLFGAKSGFTSSEWPTITLPTKEYLGGKWMTVGEVKWAAFPDWETSFRERMELLRAKSGYRKALEAKSGEEFVREVSKVWATDPKRADSVLLTYRCNFARLEQVKAECAKAVETVDKP